MGRTESSRSSLERLISKWHSFASTLIFLVATISLLIDRFTTYEDARDRSEDRLFGRIRLADAEREPQSSRS
jgi:hypothetical protein